MFGLRPLTRLSAILLTYRTKSDRQRMTERAIVLLRHPILTHFRYILPFWRSRTLRSFCAFAGTHTHKLTRTDSAVIVLLILTDTERFFLVWNGAWRTFVALRLRVSGLYGTGRAVLAFRVSHCVSNRFSLGVRTGLAGHCTQVMSKQVAWMYAIKVKGNGGAYFEGA